MSRQELMGIVVPLMTAAEAAAALAAKLRLDMEGGGADPAVAEALDRVAALVAPPGVLDDLDETSRRAVVGTVTSFLKQALDLIEDPARPGGWVYTDPVVLQSQGQSSGDIPGLIARAAPSLPGLDEALARDGACILTSARASPRCRSPVAGCSPPRPSWGSSRGRRRWTSDAPT